MKSLFNEDAFAEIEQRLEKLSANTSPQWGKMNAGQMTSHCQKPLIILLGRDTFGLKPNFFIKLLFKPMMYNDTPWKKNMPTMKFFKVENECDFDKEIRELKSLLNEVSDHRAGNEKWPKHPVFGEMTDEQWGKMQYKHLDHHLRQFGV